MRPEGNPAAVDQMQQVLCTVPRKWRGIGEIPDSGWALRPDYAQFDADLRFEVQHVTADEPRECVAGRRAAGAHASRTNARCSARGARPTVRWAHPMVSAEGACAAYYRYRRRRIAHSEGLAHDDIHSPIH